MYTYLGEEKMILVTSRGLCRLYASMMLIIMQIPRLGFYTTIKSRPIGQLFIKPFQATEIEHILLVVNRRMFTGVFAIVTAISIKDFCEPKALLLTAKVMRRKRVGNAHELRTKPVWIHVYYGFTIPLITI